MTASLKNKSKDCHINNGLTDILGTKFGVVMHIGPANRMGNKNFEFNFFNP